MDSCAILLRLSLRMDSKKLANFLFHFGENSKISTFYLKSLETILHFSFNVCDCNVNQSPRTKLYVCYRTSDMLDSSCIATSYDQIRNYKISRERSKYLKCGINATKFNCMNCSKQAWL